MKCVAQRYEAEGVAQHPAPEETAQSAIASSKQVAERKRCATTTQQVTRFKVMFLGVQLDRVKPWEILPRPLTCQKALTACVRMRVMADGLPLGGVRRSYTSAQDRAQKWSANGMMHRNGPASIGPLTGSQPGGHTHVPVAHDLSHRGTKLHHVGRAVAQVAPEE